MAELISEARGFELLNELLESYSDKLSGSTRHAFEGMRDRTSRSLSPRQREWITDAAMRFGVIDETSKNLWSSKSPAEQARIRGREVKTLPALLPENLPKRPPGRSG